MKTNNKPSSDIKKAAPRRATKRSASTDNLHAIYIDMLKDVYSAEQQIVKALPRAIDAVENQQLKESLGDHLAQTLRHVKAVAQIAKRHGEEPTGEHCEGMEGLLEECDEAAQNHDFGPVRDAALIAACQKVEHYEIASYGTLRAFANVMKHTEDGSDLSAIFDEETAADQILTKIAEVAVNERANARDRGARKEAVKT